jgi:hypothetical protein
VLRFRGSAERLFKADLADVEERGIGLSGEHAVLYLVSISSHMVLVSVPSPLTSFWVIECPERLKGR